MRDAPMFRRPLSLCVFGAAVLVGGCAKTVTHHGLAKDGYGFTNDSGRLAPPTHLTTHIAPDENSSKNSSSGT